MFYIHELLFLDIAAVTIYLVTAALSKRLGEALKIGNYFKLFYVSIVLTFTASIIDMLINIKTLEYIELLSVLLRFAGGLFAVSASLKYWKWLFPEFIKK